MGFIMRYQVGSFILLLAFGLSQTTALASLGAGIAVSQGQSPYKGVDSNPNTIPGFISYEGKKGYFRGIEAGYYLWGAGDRQRNYQLLLLASGRLEGYHASDSDHLQGMETRRWSLDGGVGLVARQGFHQLTLKAVTDLLGKHEGQEVSASYGYRWMLNSKLAITPSASLGWMSADLLDYYYGVTQGESRPWRSAYSADAGWQPSLGVTGTYSVTPHTSLMLATRTRWLPASATASPLVDRDHISGVFAAIMFRF